MAYALATAHCVADARCRSRDLRPNHCRSRSPRRCRCRPAPLALPIAAPLPLAVPLTVLLALAQRGDEPMSCAVPEPGPQPMLRPALAEGDAAGQTQAERVALREAPAAGEGTAGKRAARRK